MAFISFISVWVKALKYKSLSVKAYSEFFFSILLKIYQFVLNFYGSSLRVVDKWESFQLELLTLWNANSRIKLSLWVDMPSCSYITVWRVSNIACFRANSEKLNWHFLEMPIVQNLRCIISSLTNFATSNFIECSIMIVQILIKACQAWLTLISIEISKFSSATSSARDRFLLWQLDCLSVILVTDHWHFPEILFESLVFLGIADWELESVVTCSARLSLATRFLADGAWGRELVWGTILAEGAERARILEVLVR